MAGVKAKSAVKRKKVKGKRWKKGHSSESNPEIKKHRESAKNRFFNVNTGSSSLTVEAVAKHDAGQVEEMACDDALSDVRSSGALSAKTFNTWATNWTDCTNATFGKVHRYWASNSALHKEVLAVLAAVTEIIKETGGTESETSYFAALLTTLDTVEDEQSITAVTYLLCLVIKRVPQAVLKTRFSEVSKRLLELLELHSNTASAALLRSLLLCLSQLLRVQEQMMWSNASTLHIYNNLLAFITHPKPKVRKAAQQAVRVVLKTSCFMLTDSCPPSHPAASATAKYCIQLIEDSGASGESTNTLHTLGLLQYILGHFPHNSLKSTCETILRVMTLANQMVSSVAMKTLHGMFVSQPKASCLSAELNAQIITALYDYQPSDGDGQPVSAWMAVMESAHINLHRLSEQLCLSHVPRLVASSMRCLQSENRHVCETAAKTIKAVVRSCLTPSVELIESVYRQGNSSSPVHKVVSSVSAGLGYQYHSSWSLILGVIAELLEALGKTCAAPLLVKCIQSMCELRDSHRFAYKFELDSAVGVAVTTMGPRAVLEAVPLNITGDEDTFDFPRSWLLPVLRDHVRRTQLAYFTTYFLPLAAKLRMKSIEYSNQNAVLPSKTYDALQAQIWSLLPGFCTQPTDLHTSFRGVAKVLGSALTDRPDLKMDILTSLRKLISQNLENEENRCELSKYSKNFLPILFNLYTAEEGEEGGRDPSRMAILETIKCYLQISNPQVINSFYDRCAGKLTEDDVATFRRHALMDLCISMVVYVDTDRINNMYEAIKIHLQSADRTVQKKSYRLLEEVCSSSSAACVEFVASRLTDLQSSLLNSLSSSSPSSKAPRLRCLIHMFKRLKETQLEFLTAVVPEAILCTKEVAEKARTAAYNLLVEMGHAAGRWYPGGDPVRTYLEIVLAGLAGSHHMVSCTVLALSRLVYEFKDGVEVDMLSVLVDAVCLLLSSKSREIVDSSLGLCKIVLSVFSDSQLAQHLKNIVSSLVAMKTDNKHHFRFKSKDVFTRLIRKFGFEVIYGMVPAGHQKMLNNVRKTNERNKRRKKEQGGEEEVEGGEAFKPKIETIDDLLNASESELEDSDDDKHKVKAKRGKKKAGGSAWLREEGEEIIDFMDPTVSQKLLATKPETSRGQRQGVKHEFKTAPDGRLIITDNTETVDKQRKAEDDDLDDLLNALEGGVKQSKKRKLGVEDLVDNRSAVSSTYQPGGRGIHRPLGGATHAKKQKADSTNESGKQFKAKKAGGDVKKTGKHDPYAYVPLDRKALNRRKQAKTKGQFKNFIKGAQKGAAKGSKLKNKSKK